MFRQRIIWLAFGLLILASLACNAFAGEPEPAFPLPPPPTISASTPAASGTRDDVATSIAPTATLPATLSATTIAGASGEASVTMLVDLNVRSGPGVQYDRVSFLFKGETVPVTGRDPESDWWKIVCPPRADTSECWVSGSARYTVITNGEGVPIAAVPPTPTPVPTAGTPDAETADREYGLLAYASRDGLWVMPLNLNQDPPSALEPDLLVDNLVPDSIRISPDGRQIAYLAGSPEENEIHVIDVNNPVDRLLVSSGEIPALVEGDISQIAVLINEIQWAADSRTIAFNTGLNNLTGPGYRQQEDLWTVTIDGTLSRILQAGDGGGSFAISRSNQVLLGQSRAIVRTDLTGAGRETVLRFDRVNTASEYLFYPRIQWETGGRNAFAAISSPDPFGSPARASLWRIPASGSPVELRQLDSNILFDPIYWSANGSLLAYVQRGSGAAAGLPKLILADGAGENPITYATEEGLQFLAWSPDGRYFLFSGRGYFAVGGRGLAAVKTTITGSAADARWLTDESFVVATGTGSAWRIDSGNVSGATKLLTTANTDAIVFDLWTP